jgi:hypothetical protein
MIISQFLVKMKCLFYKAKMYVNSGMEEVENKISQLQTHIVTLLANKLFYK